MELEKSLSDIAQYLKDSKPTNRGEQLDEIFGVIITASTIAGCIIAPDPMGKINALATGITIGAGKPSQFIQWIHDRFNYKNGGREVAAIERNNRLAMVNAMIINLAIKEAIRDIILPKIKEYIENNEINEDIKIDLENFISNQGGDKKIRNKKIGLPSQENLNYISTYVDEYLNPIEELLEGHLIINDGTRMQELPYLTECREKINIIYNAYKIDLALEFREFALWVDINKKEEIISHIQEASGELQEIREKLDKIEGFVVERYKEETGFEGLSKGLKEFVKIQVEKSVEEISTDEIDAEMRMYQNLIEKYLDEPIQEEDSTIDIKMPKKAEIFIPQSYKKIIYSKRKHSDNFLTLDFWDSNDAAKSGVVNGEELEKELIKELIDPNNAFHPIIILGNPGAGKSMLSQMFCARLCENHEYIPFYIRLRDVKSSNNRIEAHISEGIESIALGQRIDWKKFIRKFPYKIPVVVLDGFDELLRTSNTDLNSYLDSIKELQESFYKGYKIPLRVIITSRLSIMNDVKIPEESVIIKLDSFTEARQKQWIKKWNELQTKPGFQPFFIPEDEHIKELAKEPLLLFLLAIYDFEESDLKKIVNEKLSQSILYDRLFTKFTKRQLEKDDEYVQMNKANKDKQEQQFRLRQGLIAFMMFIKDTTNHSGNELDEEMEEFKLVGKPINAKKVFGGFFFIHENKSCEEYGSQKLNYEFLHKTFGEFLAVDFLIKGALYRVDKYKYKYFDRIKEETIFRICFGYNWLAKHPNIVKFLLEYAPISIDSDETKKNIIRIIKEELKSIHQKDDINFAQNEVMCIKRLRYLDHLAIYTQNLVILWRSIEDKEKDIEFILNEDDEEYIENISKIDKSNYNIYEDIEEINENIIIWKKLCKLWKMSKGNYATAQLSKWIKVKVEESNLILSSNEVNTEIINYYNESANIECNDYELMISYNNSEFDLEDIDNILQRKPQLLLRALEVVDNRFEYLFSKNQYKLIKWINKKRKLNPDIFSQVPNLVVNYGKRTFDFSWLIEGFGIQVIVQLDINTQSEIIKYMNTCIKKDRNKNLKKQYTYIIRKICEVFITSNMYEYKQSFNTFWEAIDDIDDVYMEKLKRNLVRRLVEYDISYIDLLNKQYLDDYYINKIYVEYISRLKISILYEQRGRIHSNLFERFLKGIDQVELEENELMRVIDMIFDNIFGRFNIARKTKSYNKLISSMEIYLNALERCMLMKVECREYIIDHLLNVIECRYINKYPVEIHSKVVDLVCNYVFYNRKNKQILINYLGDIAGRSEFNIHKIELEYIRHRISRFLNHEEIKANYNI